MQPTTREPFPAARATPGAALISLPSSRPTAERRRNGNHFRYTANTRRLSAPLRHHDLAHSAVSRAPRCSKSDANRSVGTPASRGRATPRACRRTIHALLAGSSTTSTLSTARTYSGSSSKLRTRTSPCFSGDARAAFRFGAFSHFTHQ